MPCKAWYLSASASYTEFSSRCRQPPLVRQVPGLDLLSHSVRCAFPYLNAKELTEKVLAAGNPLLVPLKPNTCQASGDTFLVFSGPACPTRMPR